VGCHINRFFIGARPAVRVNLRIKDDFSVFIVCHAQNCRFGSFHILDCGAY